MVATFHLRNGYVSDLELFGNLISNKAVDELKKITGDKDIVSYGEALSRLIAVGASQLHEPKLLYPLRDDEPTYLCCWTAA